MNRGFDATWYGKLCYTLVLLIILSIVPTTMISLTDNINMANTSFANTYLTNLGYTITTAGAYSGNFSVSGTLTASTANITTATIATLNAPVGRFTLTIAPASATGLMRTQSDYIASSTNASTAINNALVAASAYNGIVIVQPGNYITLENIMVPANVTLQGAAETVIIPTGAAITNGIVLNGDNITLKSLKVRLAAGAGTAGARPNVVYANNRQYIRIEDMTIIGDLTVADDLTYDRQNGIYGDNITNSVITNNVIETCGRIGVRLNASSYNVIAKNISRGNLFDGFLFYINTHHNSITGNVASGNYYDGISIGDSSAYNVITGNILTGNGGALGIYKAAYNTVTGNLMENSNVTPGPTYGIGVRITGEAAPLSANYNTVVGNIIKGNTNTGVWIYSGAYALGNKVVSNQMIANGFNLVDNGSGTVVDDISALLQKANFLPIPTQSGWTSSTNGTGAAGQVQSLTYQQIYTGVTANSRSLFYTDILGFDAPGGTLSQIDWTRKLTFRFTYCRAGSDVQAIARVQIKPTNSEGTLLGKGLGITVDDLHVYGESFGAGIGTVDLGILTSGSSIDLAIVFIPGDRVEWYLNGVLYGTVATLNQIPSTTSAGYLVHSIINGNAGGSDVGAFLMHPSITQE